MSSTSRTGNFFSGSICRYSIRKESYRNIVSKKEDDKVNLNRSIFLIRQEGDIVGAGGDVLREEDGGHGLHGHGLLLDEFPLAFFLSPDGDAILMPGVEIVHPQLGLVIHRQSSFGIA